MRIIAIFDWPCLPIKNLSEYIIELLLSVVGGTILGVLVRGERDSKLTSNIKKLIERYEKFEKSEGDVSLEIFFQPQDKKDPAANWKAYYSVGSILNGDNKDCIIAIDDALFSTHDARQLFIRLSGLGNLGYGFSLNYPTPGNDGIHYATGISTGSSSDEESEANSRWNMERLPMGTNKIAKNRHMNGYFKDIFEINLISQSHVSNLLRIFSDKSILGKITELENDNILWMPDQGNIHQIKSKLASEGLII